jgi:hypothetical protein
MMENSKLPGLASARSRVGKPQMSKPKFKTVNHFSHFLVAVYCLLFTPSWTYAQDDIIGNIEPPDWVAKHGSLEVGGEGGFGLINFFSNALRLLTIAAGLWTVINLLLAGFEFITSQGDKEKITNAQNKIWNSLIGLVIIAASYTLAVIISWIFFGDATMIIQPKITGVGTE